MHSDDYISQWCENVPNATMESRDKKKKQRPKKKTAANQQPGSELIDGNVSQNAARKAIKQIIIEHPILHTPTGTIGGLDPRLLSDDQIASLQGIEDCLTWIRALHTTCHRLYMTPLEAAVLAKLRYRQQQIEAQRYGNRLYNHFN